MKQPILGILGGLGPMSSVFFYEMLTEHTRASCDQDHLNLLLSSRADTPDRTAFITGASDVSPEPAMVAEARRLVAAGAELLAIPCNTAHCFYDSICRAVPVPVVNIIEETVRFCSFLGIKRVGVLATEGTARSGAYEAVCEKLGITCIPCAEKEQEVISAIIYQQIKQGKEPDLEAFLAVADAMTARGAEALILGCTELSLLKKHHLRDARLIDSMEVLARSVLALCGKETVGFEGRLADFSPSPLLL